MGKIRAIIKRPDENYGHVAHISSELGNLQKTVGGYVEAIYLLPATVILVNEEGRLKQMAHNFTIRWTPNCDSVPIFGTAIVAGIKYGELVDTDMDFKVWKRLLIGWGN